MYLFKYVSECASPVINELKLISLGIEFLGVSGLVMGESRQAGALAVTCVFPVLAALFVGARSFSRYIGQNFGWDDWLIHLSLLLLLGQTLTLYECMFRDSWFEFMTG